MRIKSLVFAGIVAVVSMATYAEEYEPIEEPVGATVVSSQKYVDDELAKKQPQFAGLGNDKLMLYSNTTNGAVASRDIVTELGDSTTANTVPTVGAINTGLATKQNTLNGTAGWVVENTGSAGNVKQRPVYSATNNYKTALVEAGDLNQIIIDAVNSELTVLPGIGWQINTSVTLPTLKEFWDASINGTGYCYRRLSSGTGENGYCGSESLATLGAMDSKSGLWGAVFEYGDIVGKSVCSTTSNAYQTNVATDSQNSVLDDDFGAQSGMGTPSNENARYCWCKMESVGGIPAVSRWMFRSSDSSASVCASICANFCATGVWGNFTFRSAMFNAIQ